MRGKKRMQIGTLDNFVKVTKQSLHINMNKESLLKGCLELVTVNGRPFDIFQDSGMVKILKPITDAIGGNFVINPQNIRIHVLNKAENIVNIIKNEVLNRPISFKVDCVIRLNRSIIGNNVQYQMEDKLQIRTLAISHLNDPHTGEYLKTVVLKVLNRYNITPEQIYSCTIDNGANMVKVVQLLADASHDSSDPKTILEIISEEDNVNNFSIENENENDDLQEQIVTSFESTGLGITNCFRCSAHTIQLSIYLESRFQQLLAPSMKIRAITHLNKLWLLLQGLKKRGISIDRATIDDLVEREIEETSSELRLN
ncbi:hypothetical protein AGLY_016604 [Aphis glycines]|uniref:DUF4371 domain-containing protein n=1 Tax=Aphis glycines TaxID=307491 RepID=A0A6G0SX75_APHGL|nr:hypothetical protein AGLY_016604 [Aphis glycines]